MKFKKSNKKSYLKRKDQFNNVPEAERKKKKRKETTQYYKVLGPVF